MTTDDRDVMERLVDVLERLEARLDEPGPGGHRDPKPDNVPARRRVGTRKIDLGTVNEHTRERGRAALARAGYAVASTGKGPGR